MVSPKYTPLPSAPPPPPYDAEHTLEVKEKSLPSAASPEDPGPQPAFATRRRHPIILFAAGLALLVLTAALYAVNIGLGGRSCSRSRPSRPANAEQVASEKLVNRALLDDPSAAVNLERIVELVSPILSIINAQVSASPVSSTSDQDIVTNTGGTFARYSTSTYTDGRTSTFVYTTRPIVNPGGYTIGTLTDYVPLSSSPPGTAPTSVDDSSAAPATPTPTPPPTNLSDRALDEEISLHMRHKRGMALFDDDGEEQLLEEPPLPVPTPTSASEEFSYSRLKNGETATFVKTTRPIVNPAGYTIGTLDGVFVQVRSSTTLVSTASSTPTVIAHQELRKRNMVDLAA